MSKKTTLNVILLALYALFAGGIFIAAIAVPALRPIAYAPLRELLLPEPQPVVVDMVISTEKRAWLDEMIEAFNREDIRVDGRPIEVEAIYMGSREMYLDVLDGDLQPVVMSPASSLQVSLLETLSTTRYGQPLVVADNRSQCRPTVTSPLVIVGWRERADALWGGDYNGDLWEELAIAVTNEEGWAAYGQPEWGFVKFNHTNPERSNSGLHTILLMTYAYHNKTTGLSNEDILSDEGYREWFTGFEGAITEFGDSTGSYMRDIISFGPSQYDFVAVYESLAIEFADAAVGRYGELAVFYPPATLLSDHPFCVIDGEWVTPQEADAANTFIDYILTQEALELAMFDYGFRPADPAVPVNQAGSPFLTYQENGIRLDLPPQVQVPPGDVLDTLIQFWSRQIGG
ncbi:MAG: ABC transporter substrate-binding protein [Chloroflexi bacterium]|nr:ABC transporter substrate-binding protein [Chloroflexota bacterium]